MSSISEIKDDSDRTLCFTLQNMSSLLDSIEPTRQEEEWMWDNIKDQSEFTDEEDIWMEKNNAKFEEFDKIKGDTNVQEEEWMNMNTADLKEIIDEINIKVDLSNEEIQLERETEDILNEVIHLPKFVEVIQTIPTHVCKTCEYKTVFEVHFKQHLLSVHPVHAKCDKCGKTFLNPGILKMRIAKEHNVFSSQMKSVIVRNRLRSRSVAEYTVNAEIKQKQEIYEVKTQVEAVVICNDICNEIIENMDTNVAITEKMKSSLNLHQLGETGVLCNPIRAQETMIYKQTKSITTKGYRNKCETCDFTFKKMKGLKNHIMKMHTSETLHEKPDKNTNMKSRNNSNAPELKLAEPNLGKKIVNWDVNNDFKFQINTINPEPNSIMAGPNLKKNVGNGTIKRDNISKTNSLNTKTEVFELKDTTKKANEHLTPEPKWQDRPYFKKMIASGGMVVFGYKVGANEGGDEVGANEEGAALVVKRAKVIEGDNERGNEAKIEFGSRIILEDEFGCKICGSVNKNENEQWAHLNAAHSKEAVNIAIEIMNSKANKDINVRFECDLCDQIFIFKETLQGHMKRFHDQIVNNPDTNNDSAENDIDLVIEHPEQEEKVNLKTYEYQSFIGGSNKTVEEKNETEVDTNSDDDYESDSAIEEEHCSFAEHLWGQTEDDPHPAGINFKAKTKIFSEASDKLRSSLKLGTQKQTDKCAVKVITVEKKFTLVQVSDEECQGQVTLTIWGPNKKTKETTVQVNSVKKNDKRCVSLFALGFVKPVLDRVSKGMSLKSLFLKPIDQTGVTHKCNMCDKLLQTEVNLK